MTRKAELTLDEAAELLDLTSDELTLSRQRGLSPGALGYTRPPYDGTVYFRRSDLDPAVRSADLEAAEAEPICPDCGFRAKTTGGLRSHQRTHEADAA